MKLGVFIQTKYPIWINTTILLTLYKEIVEVKMEVQVALSVVMDIGSGSSGRCGGHHGISGRGDDGPLDDSYTAGSNSSSLPRVWKDVGITDILNNMTNLNRAW